MNEDTEGHGAPEPAAEAVARPRRHGSTLAAIAVLVAVAALALAAWSAWRLQRLTQSQAAAHQQELATISGLERQLATGSQRAEAGSQQIASIEAQVGTLRNDSRGLDQRIGNLESAYATLSGQQQSGHDTLLLDNAEMLLRLGEQRFELSHDVSGALRAYAQAIDVLGQVQNPAYAAVRASAITERDALAEAAPAVPRQTALDTLARLRGQVPALPLATAAPASASSQAAQPGFWSRIGQAFGGIITVQRENQAASAAGPRFARQTLALNLAQAQEALLEFDRPAYRTALQQAASVLGSQFDGHAADVQAASAEISKLLAQGPSGPPPKLGGALAELQSVRANQTAGGVPAPGSTVPAPAAAPASGSSAS